MFRIITCAVLLINLTFGHPLPYAAQLFESPTVGVTSPVILPNTPYPYNPNIKSNNPYPYNSQYFNQYYRVGGPAVPILAYSSEHSGDGTYSFSFSTADGKQAQENGFLKDAYIDNAGEPHVTQVVEGSFAYVSPEGTPVQVNYVADENGFRPSGVHIPADGKSSVLPLPGISDGKDNAIVDPFYNRYNPYRARSQYGSRPYDPRYPYISSKYNPVYNNLNKFLDISQNRIAREHKKLL